MIPVQMDFLHVYKGENDEVEHMLHVWIDLQSRLSFWANYAQCTSVVSSDLGSRPIVP